MRADKLVRCGPVILFAPVLVVFLVFETIEKTIDFGQLFFYRLVFEFVDQPVDGDASAISLFGLEVLLCEIGRNGG